MKQFLCIALALVGFIVQGQNYPAKPKDQKPVYDYANLLTSSEENLLNRKLVQYADTTSTQIVIVTIESLEGIEINFYGTELAQKWGLGQKGKDNGILILVSKGDKKTGINTGYGVEARLTDALSRRVIENYINPEFKSGQFYTGLDNGTTAIIQIMSGEYQAPPSRKGKPEGQGIGFIIFVIIMIIVFSRFKNGGGRGGRRSGAGDVLTWMLLSNMGSSRSSGGFGSGGFGGGGGGFSGGFGGGGFGGGGASGSW